ncbi:MAG: DNA-binding response regulator [Acidobacteria bacterium]|nr:MAG: DNA-binding response regulator [Acidobacteriota bacterium]PYR72935.1 MAG: DNA-binding response regulator [Acidobacteriota bacterium]
MMKFRVLVVDDEPLARASVVSLVRPDADVDAVDECSDGLAAREAIERQHPDIVFLDIEMPGVDGLQLADRLPPGGPVVVFTTAYSQYAMQAFDVAATDYVLKPFSRERLLESLARAKRRVRERRLGELASEIAVRLKADTTDEEAVASGFSRTNEGRTNDSQYLKRLSLKQGERTLVVSVDEIIWVEAQDYCVMVHSTRGRHLLRASLASFESRLDPARFVRVHRAAMVNVAHVRETADGDGLVLKLSNGAEVGVSRARRQHVAARISSR